MYEVTSRGSGKDQLVRKTLPGQYLASMILERGQIWIRSADDNAVLVLRLV